MPSACHQKHVCDDFMPAMRKSLDAIERTYRDVPGATHPDGCDIADACGPVWWATLHATADNIGCEHCRGEAVRLIRGLHDVVNVKLGKVPQHQKDLTFLLDMAAGKHSEAREPEAVGQRRPSSAEEVADLKRGLRNEPGRRLLKYVKRSGNDKGLLTSFTKAQYRELFGKEPLPAIVNKQGQIPWEYALDRLSIEEAGLNEADHDAMYHSLERAQTIQEKIELAERNLPKPTACKLYKDDVPAAEFPEQTQAKISTCGDQEYWAVRQPSKWNLHEVEPGRKPDQYNQVATARYAKEASTLLTDLTGQRVGQEAPKRPACTVRLPGHRPIRLCAPARKGVKPVANLLEYLQQLTLQAPKDREIGFSSCKFSGPGRVATGDRDHVNIPFQCNGSNPPAFMFHTHTEQLVPTASKGDIDNARANQVPLIYIGAPLTGIVKRFRVPA